MDQDRTKELVAGAKKIARRVDSWINRSNALSDPVGGLISRCFPDPGQREEFRRRSCGRNLGNEKGRRKVANNARGRGSFRIARIRK
jgi:hypothetical protein